MLKAIIMCKNFSTAKKIANNILYNIVDLQIVGITNNLKEFKKQLIKTNAEVIISTNTNVVDLIEEDPMFYGKKIILLSKETKIDTTYQLFVLINYDLSFQEISKNISNFIKKDSTISKKEKAINVMSKLGFNFKLIGTLYLLESILYVNSYQGAVIFEQLKRDIYSYVAKLYNTNSDRVKWAVDRSIMYMYDTHTKETYTYVENFFGLANGQKPTAKLIVNFIANNLNT